MTGRGKMSPLYASEDPALQVGHFPSWPRAPPQLGQLPCALISWSIFNLSLKRLICDLWRKMYAISKKGACQPL